MPKTNKNRKKFSQKKAKVRQNREIKSNPFEIHLNHQKHTILGKKSKHERGNPGFTRNKGIEKRKKTLLKEYQQRHKSNKFLDRRIGENDPTMSFEEKMMERFAFEKQKVHEKSAAYNLAEDDEELTHFGQSLAEIEKFEEPLSDVEDENDPASAIKLVADSSGGILHKKNTNNENNGQPKSREEVMLEIIANSKKEKYERQREREGTRDLTEELDKDFREVSHLLANIKNSSDDQVQQKADDYDIRVRELMYDIKAKATDRLKTPEEQAKEESEQLEKLEADRKRRMLGLSVEGKTRKPKYQSPDDLNDDYALVKEDKAMLSYKDGKPLNPSFFEREGVKTDDKYSDDDSNYDNDVTEDEDEKETQETDDEDEEEARDSEDIDDLESDHESVEDDDDDEDGSDTKDKDSTEDDKKRHAKEESKKTKKIEIMKAAKEELPFTYEVPTCYNDLVGLLGHHTTSNQMTILERMRRCTHPSLAEGNKSKLESLLSLLVQYFLAVASEESLNIELIDGLTKHIYELSKTSHIPTGKCLQDTLMEKYKTFQYDCEQRGQGVYPDASVLLYFKLVSLIFPTSDFRHCIVTPALLFMGEILSQCSVKSTTDIAKGLFVCNLFLQYVHLSKRIVPEAINFLHGLLFLSKVKKQSDKYDTVFPPFKPIGKHINYLVLTSENSQSPSKPCRPWQMKKLFSTRPDSIQQNSDEFRIWATTLTLKLLQRYFEMYKEHICCAELFAPVRQALANKWINIDKYPIKSQESHQKLLDDILELDMKPRRSLERQRKRPVSLKMFEPRFDEEYDPTRKHHDTGNKEVNEKKKLMHKHRQEVKGAMRELRKDTQFIARQKLNEQMERDAERKRKVKQIYGMLASQEGDFKAMQRKAKKVKF